MQVTDTHNQKFLNYQKFVFYSLQLLFICSIQGAHHNKFSFQQSTLDKFMKAYVIHITDITILQV